MMFDITEELFNFGNLIRSVESDRDENQLMSAFAQLRAIDGVNVLGMCNTFHGTSLDMAIEWKRDALVAALVPLFVDKIELTDDDDDDDDGDFLSNRDYDNDPACHLLDALRTASMLGRVEFVRVILSALANRNIALSTLERRAPPGSDPVLVSAIRGWRRSHEFPELLDDCANHGRYDSCGFDPAVHRSHTPSEHSPVTSLAIVDLLLLAGVDVRAANEMETNCTAFCTALEFGELPIARALFAHDPTVAHMPARMHLGRGALQAAVDGNDLACVQFFVETCNGAADIASVQVCASTHRAIVDLLNPAPAAANVTINQRMT
jgi:hypothetical protein